MNFGFSLYKNKNTRIFLLWLLALIITFPAFDMSFSFGIDPCLPWVFHHIQQAGFDKGHEIIFPYGPLTFLMYPLYINPLPAIFSYVFLALSLYFLLSTLMTENGKKSLVLPFIFSIIILTISGFNLLLFSVIAVSYLIFLKRDKAAYLYFGLILSSIGVFIKINIAIIAGILSFIILLYILFKKKKYVLTLSGVVLVLLCMVLIWLGMYGNLQGFIEYFIGLLHLASGNSSATALFPDNNWFYLSLSLVFLVITFLLIRNRKSGEFALVFILPFFAAWKHGMGRQDYLHYLQFLHFTLILILLLFAFTGTKRILSILSGLTVVLLLYLNFNSIKSFPSYSYNLEGPVNFYHLITDYNAIKEKAEIESDNKIKNSKISSNFQHEIGDHTVDIYPWDYSVIAANGLNWSPRPGLQSFLGYSSWLDERNMKHFNSEDAPEYLIWHYNPFNSDVNPGRMESVDERYLLNDEPQTNISIIEHYDIIEKDKDFMLFKKRSVSLQQDKKVVLKDRLGWNEWLEISGEDEKSVMQIRAVFKRNMIGELLNFLYKDVPVYMIAETENGLSFRYRIAPGNAEDGIWINPLLQNISSEACPFKVKKLMFQTTGLNRMKKDIPFEINSLTYTSVKGEKEQITSIFDKVECQKDRVIFSLEKEYSPDENILAPGGYAPGISFQPDSSISGEFWFQVRGYVKVGDNPDAKLVLEIFDRGERKLYNSASFSGFFVDNDKQSPILISHKFHLSEEDRPLVKTYFWNASEKKIEIYSLKMMVVKVPDH